MTEPPRPDLARLARRTRVPNADLPLCNVVDLPCVPMSSRCAAPATPHVWVSVYQFTRPRFPRLPDESRAGSCRSAGAGRSVALAAAAAAAAAAVGPNADCHLRCALTISARRHVLRVPRHHTQPLPHGQPLRARAFSAPEELGALPATSNCFAPQARLWRLRRRGAATPSPSRPFAPQARPASGDIAVPLPSNLRRRLVCGVMRRRGAAAPLPSRLSAPQARSSSGDLAVPSPN